MALTSRVIVDFSMSRHFGKIKLWGGRSRRPAPTRAQPPQPFVSSARCAGD